MVFKAAQDRQTTFVTVSRHENSLMPAQLVRLSIDRPKRSTSLWMQRTELAEYESLLTFNGKTAHLTNFPAMAAIERSLVEVCPRCLDELLVRCGEQPAQPVSRESAFDISPVAAEAVISHNLRICAIHGLFRPTRSSRWIAEAIKSNRMLSGRQLIRTTFIDHKHSSGYWFDADYLHKRFGSAIDLTSSAFRLERQHADVLLKRAARVCPRCLRDLLMRHGIEV